MTLREMLRNSPHTLKMLTSTDWPYSYSREDASFPKSYLKTNKFWPSVRRVDEAYGDRNLICAALYELINNLSNFIK